MAASRSSKAAGVTLLVLIALSLLVFLVHVGYGSTSFLWPPDVIRELLRGHRADTGANIAVWDLRLPRALGCLLIGGILACVGSAFQGLFRNPLAEPYVVGVSTGAAVGAVIVVVAGFSEAFGGLAKDGAAFAGGMLSLGLVMALAGRRGATNVMTLLLAGVVVGAMLSSLLSLSILASGRDANQLLRWLMGNTYDLRWPDIGLLAVALVLGAALLISQSRALNAFAIGEETAKRLGVNTRSLKAIVLVAGTAMAAISVGAAGVIGFLGLVAPHIARSLVGTDWRRSLLASIPLGASLLLLADVFAQRVIPWATALSGLSSVTDLPVGVVTALIGAPSLLILLRRTASGA